MKKKQLVLDEKILTYYTNIEPSSGDRSGSFLFLHGWMQDGKSFQDIFRILEEENISYISLDLPGFGGSSLQNYNMTIEDYGQTVIDFIHKQKLKSPLIIGHSFGGRIAIYIGSFYKNINKIILIGSAGINTPMHPFRIGFVKIGKYILSCPGLSKLRKIAKNAVSSSDYKGAGKMEQIFRNTISNDLRKYMLNIKIPCLMIWGKYDDQVPVSEAKIIQQHIRDSKLHVLEGTHFIHQEKGKDISDLILQFSQT